jgi:hypothetical protein
MKSTVIWGITPCNPVKVSRRFGGACRLRFQDRSIKQARNQRGRRWQAEPCLAYSLTLKMEATWSSETSVDFQRAARRYVREDGRTSLNVKLPQT